MASPRQVTIMNEKNNFVDEMLRQADPANNPRRPNLTEDVLKISAYRERSILKSPLMPVVAFTTVLAIGAIAAVSTFGFGRSLEPLSADDSKFAENSTGQVMSVARWNVNIRLRQNAEFQNKPTAASAYQVIEKPITHSYLQKLAKTIGVPTHVHRISLGDGQTGNYTFGGPFKVNSFTGWKQPIIQVGPSSLSYSDPEGLKSTFCMHQKCQSTGYNPMLYKRVLTEKQAITFAKSIIQMSGWNPEDVGFQYRSDQSGAYLTANYEIAGKETGLRSDLMWSENGRLEQATIFRGRLGKSKKVRMIGAQTAFNKIAELVANEQSDNSIAGEVYFHNGTIDSAAQAFAWKHDSQLGKHVPTFRTYINKVQRVFVTVTKTDRSLWVAPGFVFSGPDGTTPPLAGVFPKQLK
jgi:hypothetical protein